MSQRVVETGIRKLSVWPQRQGLAPLDEPSIKLTRFHDTGHYHPALRRRILELREDPRFRDYIFHGGCGTKVRWIDRGRRI